MYNLLRVRNYIPNVKTENNEKQIENKKELFLMAK